ncbi:uncharacterized protein PADG_11700 [Paracoccidioides brasiliensis Pb18]|uniref:Uncharacterized protein n=1 Tax=Paracoccidioides brasiliensis (strain Pb18) TaxID=502780 RepID=A0A0A0HU68_PARBD|nr:uncharacterized protein PADG_11700 [Paracoccidioides brasiliensis Pb18]KGM92162.1 hypothetical protein PADG_11700 [Paracoccidioides brasiliensis Pb18]
MSETTVIQHNHIDDDWLLEAIKWQLGLPSILVVAGIHQRHREPSGGYPIHTHFPPVVPNLQGFSPPTVHPQAAKPKPAILREGTRISALCCFQDSVLPLGPQRLRIRKNAGDAALSWQYENTPAVHGLAVAPGGPPCT